jgi:hypothetical protein
LIAPWPGWRETYANYFRGLAAMCYATESGMTVVRVQPANHPPRPEIDAEFAFVGREKLYAGEGKLVEMKCYGLDSRGVGWVPTALLIALLIPTTLPWERRWRVWLAGIVLIHAYILAVMGFALWNASEGTVPIPWIPFWPVLGYYLDETFVTQIGPSFVVPVLAWLLSVMTLGVQFASGELRHSKAAREVSKPNLPTTERTWHRS